MLKATASGIIDVNFKRPIGYKVPVFIEEAGKKQNEKTVTAKEAMAEWLRWIAYVNYLEKELSK
jgi:hypothetical protein